MTVPNTFHPLRPLTSAVQMPVLPSLQALSLTLAVELPLAYLLGLRDRCALLAVFLLNCVTNPAINALAPLTGELISLRLVLVLILESAVILIEGLLLALTLRRNLLRMLGVSLVLNISSYAAGVMVFGF